MTHLKAKLKSKKKIRINPGEQYVSTGDEILTTLLGSCVAACLYDPVNQVAGMNHFLLANQRYTKNSPLITSESGRYGIHAMEMLINEMLKKGAMKRYLKAKAFGGGSIMKTDKGNFSCVGEVNSRFIEEFLDNENIPLVASDLGGEQGRVIHFFSNDYTVYRKMIQPAMSADLVVAEEKYWSKKIEKQVAVTDNVELWD